jgi:hypothetical protein
VTVVEWIERWLPKSRPSSFTRLVSIETLGETERRITYEDSRA